MSYFNLTISCLSWCVFLYGDIRKLSPGPCRIITDFRFTFDTFISLWSFFHRDLVNTVYSMISEICALQNLPNQESTLTTDMLFCQNSIFYQVAYQKITYFRSHCSVDVCISAWLNALFNSLVCFFRFTGFQYSILSWWLSFWSAWSQWY